MTTPARMAGVGLGLFALVALVPAAMPAEAVRPVGGEHAAAPAVHTVVIEATSFRPATLRVRVGDTIVWRNDDMFPHTATSRDGGFDSGSIAPGSSWRHTVGAGTGTTSYVCTYHPTMKGVLEVAAPQ